MLASAIIVLGIPAFAEPPLIESVQIGRAVTIGASTNTWVNPLEKHVDLRLSNGTLKSLLDEVGRQTNTEFVLLQDLDQCRVSAFLRNMTTREVLGMLLVVRGLTYQNDGRSNHYLITRRKGGQACPPKTEVAAGSCSALQGIPISLECNNGPLSALTELLYDQSDASFLVWNEVVDYPVSMKLKRSKLEKALKILREDRSLDVRQMGTGNRYAIGTAIRTTAPEQSAISNSEAISSTANPVGTKRQEPPANPVFTPEMPNPSLDQPAAR